jgi:UPF0176 protein
MYREGVSCAACFDTRDDAKKRALAERQRQVALAKARGQAHIAAEMPQRPRATDPADGGRILRSRHND